MKNRLSIFYFNLFLIESFDKAHKSQTYNDNGRTGRKSRWQCLKQAYKDLTDDLPGLIFVGVFPHWATATILVGGTIQYCRQP